MDRSREDRGRGEAVPTESRLTLDRARRNKRRSAPLRERAPSPRAVVISCSRILRRLAPVMFLLALGGSAAYGARAGWHFLMTSPRFAVTHVDVRGAHAMSPDAIRERAPITLGENIFQIDLTKIDAALADEPWIASVTSSRELPHGILIEVHERVAAAAVLLDGIYLADAEGRLFKRAHGDEAASLPVITGLTRDDVSHDPDSAGARIRAALAALATWGDSRPKLGELHVDVRRAVTFYTFDDAVAIFLGSASGDALAARLDDFDAAWAALTPDERARARAIHLDLDSRPDHVTVAFAK